MPSFDLGDVVRVPFPYTDRATRQHRPALVVSSPHSQAQHGLLWVLMITSAENRGWPNDVAIVDLDAAGLPVASVVRTAKIATIDVRDAQPLGKLRPRTRAEVMRHVAQTLGK